MSFLKNRKKRLRSAEKHRNLRDFYGDYTAEVDGKDFSLGVHKEQANVTDFTA